MSATSSPIRSPRTPESRRAMKFSRMPAAGFSTSAT
jgi:hypothetical protein